MLFLLRSSCFRCTPELLTSILAVTRECSLTVLLCQRRFRSTGMLFLLCSSCFRCTPELLTSILAVTRVFFDSSSLSAKVPQYWNAVPSTFFLLPLHSGTAHKHSSRYASVLRQFFSVSEGSAVLECCSFYVLLASAALRNCSQAF